MANMPNSDSEISAANELFALSDRRYSTQPLFSSATPSPLKLCHECAQWNWPKIRSQLSHLIKSEQKYLDAFNSHGSSRWEGFVPASRQPGCPLCDWKSYSGITFANRIIYGDSKRTRKGAPVLDRAGESMVVLQHSQSLKERFAPRIINARSIDYSVLRMWLKRCTEKHSETCLPRKVDLPSSFKLLHCATRSVMKVARKVPYLALSYVWGQASSVSVEKDTFPRTIEDAMTVTLNLGFDYLWVDRYCIDQTNTDEKHDQIQNMGTIYSGAELVIFAVAGGDPSYGLPGVSTRARRLQRIVEVDDYALVETYPNLNTELAASTWTKRAWTYQEGHLSRRRLMFTDQQASYICDYGYCVETLRSLIRNFDCLHKYNTGELFTTSYEQHESWYYHRCLAEYTKREMSYDSDSLNAYLGVLSAWAPSIDHSLESTFVHLWGLKITKNWLALDWYHERPGKRRVGFPTWTWASTQGTVEYYGLSRDRVSEHLELIVETVCNDSLSSPQRDVMNATTFRPLHEYFADLDGRSPDLRWAPKCLKITGFSPANILLLRRERYEAHWTVQLAMPGPPLSCTLYCDFTMTRNDANDCIALRVHDILLFLKPTKDQDVFERVGLLAPRPDLSRGFDYFQTWPSEPKRTVILI